MISNAYRFTQICIYTRTQAWTHTCAHLHDKRKQKPIQRYIRVNFTHRNHQNRRYYIGKCREGRTHDDHLGSCDRARNDRTNLLRKIKFCQMCFKYKDEEYCLLTNDGFFYEVYLQNCRSNVLFYRSVTFAERTGHPGLLDTSPVVHICFPFRTSNWWFFNFIAAPWPALSEQAPNGPRFNH